MKQTLIRFMLLVLAILMASQTDIKAKKVHTLGDTEYLGLPVPAITYSGAAPDLGAYETTYDNPTAIGQAVVNHAPTGRARALITASGRIVIKVYGGALYNAAGQQLK